MSRYFLALCALALSPGVIAGCSGSAENECECTGCAGQAGNAGQGGSAGAAGNPAGNGGSAGNAGSVNPNSIGGSWEFTGTRYGTGEVVGVISLSADHFFIQTSGGGVSAALAGDGLWGVLVTDDTDKEAWEYQWELPASTSFTAQQSLAAPFDVGAFPIDLSGSWGLDDREGPHSGTTGCSSSLWGDTWTAMCREEKRFPWMPDFANGSIECKRTSALASMFGDFGGEWKCTTTPANAACTFRFEGATISSNCSNAPGMDGTMTITFNGEIASGQTSTGFEFSAKRN